MFRIGCFILGLVFLLAEAKVKKIKVKYPVELLRPVFSPHFTGNATKNKLLCFGNRDYADPNIRDAMICLLQLYIPFEYNCNGIWGSRSIIVESTGSIEFLKVNKLPHDSDGDLVSMNVTKWLELPSLNPFHTQREVKHSPAEPIYLCARSTYWDETHVASFHIQFRTVHPREPDRRHCQQKLLIHIVLVAATVSVWALPYLIATVVAVYVYLHGIKIFITCSILSGLVVCSAPIMLTKKNKHLAGHYLAYFLPGVKAEETLNVMRRRLPVFQAIFFSSAVVCIGSTGSYMIYSYFGIDREHRNTLIRITLGLASSWFVFFLSRSLERFLRDWIWVAMTIAIAQILGPHLNPMCHDEVVGAIIALSFVIVISVRRFLSKIPFGLLVVNFFNMSSNSQARLTRSEDDWGQSEKRHLLLPQSPNDTPGIDNAFKSTDCRLSPRSAAIPANSSEKVDRSATDSGLKSHRDTVMPLPSDIQRSSSLDLADLYPHESGLKCSITPDASCGRYHASPSPSFESIGNINAISPSNGVSVNAGTDAAQADNADSQYDSKYANLNVKSNNKPQGVISVSLNTAGPIYYHHSIDDESINNLRGPCWLPIAGDENIAKTVQMGCDFIHRDNRCIIESNEVDPVDPRLSVSTSIAFGDTKKCKEAKLLLSGVGIARRLQQELQTKRFALTSVCVGTDLGIRLVVDTRDRRGSSLFHHLQRLKSTLAKIERVIVDKIFTQDIPLSTRMILLRANLPMFPADMEAETSKLFQSTVHSSSVWIHTRMMIVVYNVHFSESLLLAHRSTAARSRLLQIAVALFSALQVKLPIDWLVELIASARLSVTARNAKHGNALLESESEQTVVDIELHLPRIFSELISSEHAIVTKDSSFDSDVVSSHCGELCCRLLLGSDLETEPSTPTTSYYHNPTPSHSQGTIDGLELSHSFAVALTVGYLGHLLQTLENAHSNNIQEAVAEEEASYDDDAHDDDMDSSLINNADYFANNFDEESMLMEDVNDDTEIINETMEEVFENDVKTEAEAEVDENS